MASGIRSFGTRRRSPGRAERRSLSHRTGCLTLGVSTTKGALRPWLLGCMLLNRSAFLHVLNSDEGRLLEQLRLTCPLEVIPNGVYFDEIGSASDGDFFANTFGFSGSNVVLFLSRLHYKKGLDHLAAAFAILHQSHPEAHLVVAGPDGGAQDDFVNQVSRLRLSERVHVIGPLYGKDKYAAMRSAACFCLPSRQEGFSVAILEQVMACRLPVVISEACHFPEVAENGAGRIVALDPPAIAA